MGRPSGTVLLVDEAGGGGLGEAPALRGLAVAIASPAGAVGAAARHGDVLVLPLRCENTPASEVLARARKRDPHVQLLLTATPEELTSALPASRHGACDVLLRPLDASALRAAVEVALTRRALAAEHALLESELPSLARLSWLDTLLGATTHELNNPITSLVASARFVADGLQDLRRLDVLCDSSPVLQAWWTKDGRALLDDLGGAAGDLLESAGRIQSLARDLSSVVGHDIATTFDLCDAVQAAVRISTAEVRRHAVLHLEAGAEPVLVNASRGALTQCFVHLLFHAAHAFAAAGRRGTLRVAVRRGGEGAVVEVADDAPPLASAEGEPPRELFPRSPAARLGLALDACAHVVARHGGAVAVERSVEGGTAVRLTLPLARSRSSEPVS